ncbi:ABC transporter ATP-binding protein [Brevibacillus ruminantium]|uniref:ABC transporter ATP-binding protein n=1 Tax=Brevibacillus ruminantium TaxID=2950604 RepID=A0ABY4WGM7_9BACL|nr:ABC transporter ATP-binding protein [Brevibacillus ruminantium]USG66320.1 ABC transporter ATP-binding protein [Brevibacillus ruminantium]
MILVQNLRKTYRIKAEELPVLDVPSFHVEQGEQVAIIGPSGSGKSTLLHLIGGVLSADSGQLLVNGQDLTKMNERERDHFRSTQIGYIFQDFHLIPSLTAEENVRLVLPKGDAQTQKKLLQEWFGRVGLEKRRTHRPTELSRGEQQRVAMIRSLINQPRLVLADEPTGSLDWETAQQMMSLMLTLCREENLTLLCVTHDLPLAKQFPRIVQIGEINQTMHASRKEVAIR